MKRTIRQRLRTWKTNPRTGLSVFSCGCGVRIIGLAGDPKEWADHHVCNYDGFSVWGGIRT